MPIETVGSVKKIETLERQRLLYCDLLVYKRFAGEIHSLSAEI